MNRALYPGSFDPFTIGHLSVLEKSIRVFDEVIIALSQNPKKKRRYDIYHSAYCILKLLESKDFYNNKVKVFWTDDFIPARIAQSKNCNYIIRGLRNHMDYDYEEGLAKFNKVVCADIETVYFRADNDSISSTMVYSLDKAGISVGQYIPYNALLLCSNDNSKASIADVNNVHKYLQLYYSTTWEQK